MPRGPAARRRSAPGAVPRCQHCRRRPPADRTAATIARRGHGLRRAGSLDEAVADAGFGDEPGRGGILGELLAQLARVDAQVLRLTPVLRAPHLLEDRAVGEDTTGVASEEREEVELLRREV